MTASRTQNAATAAGALVPSRLGSSGVSSATISWTAPSDGGSPITGYTITPYAGSAAQVPTTVNGSPPATSATVAVSNGVSYTFTVSVVDNGTSGKNGDTISILIKSPASATVFTTGGPLPLKGGNIVVH